MTELMEQNPAQQEKAPAIVSGLGCAPQDACSAIVSDTPRERLVVLASRPMPVGDVVKVETTTQICVGEVISSEAREEGFVTVVSPAYTVAKVELERMVRDWRFRPSMLEAGSAAA